MCLPITLDLRTASTSRGVFADETGADQDVAVILDRDVMPTFWRPQQQSPNSNCCVVKSLNWFRLFLGSTQRKQYKMVFKMLLHYQLIKPAHQ